MGRLEEHSVRPFVAFGDLCAQHRSNGDYHSQECELRDKSSSPRASVISIPELFTYALYFVIAIVLEVIYLAIT